MSTEAYPIKKAFTSDQTGSSFTAKLATLTSPFTSASPGDGCVEPPKQSRFTPNLLLVKPYGSDADNETFSFQVWRWCYNYDTGLYEPMLIIECACILGNLARNGTTFYDCDTITETTGDTETTRDVSNTADKGGAYIVLDPIGPDYVEFEAAVGTGAAANLLYQWIS